MNAPVAEIARVLPKWTPEDWGGHEETLRLARGRGRASLYNMIVQAGDDVMRVRADLRRELSRSPVGSAESVAIAGVLERLRSLDGIPRNGLIVFCGTLDTTETVCVAFEPWARVRSAVFLCDDRFHTDAVGAVLAV